MRPKYLFREDSPVTMQIAIRAQNGFVLASDTNNGTTEGSTSTEPGGAASYSRHATKVRINSTHGIAIAIAGYSQDGIDESLSLANELERTEKLPDDFAAWLEDWANGYLESNHPAQCSLLVVHPKADANRILVLDMTQRPCKAIPNNRCVLHPHATSPSNFWPQLLRADQRPTLKAAVHIAALSIVMAGELNFSSVSGLELFEYDGAWKRFTEKENEGLEDRCRRVTDAIKEVVGS
jgi:hypothetical protein